MSEQKKRTSTDILNEYNGLAFRAGNLQYKLAQDKKDLDAFNSAMRDLTLEYNKVKAVEDEVAKATAEAVEKAKVEDTGAATASKEQ